MAEYRLQFTADASSANRSINSLQKAVQAVTREFEKAEISSEEFLSAASDLSRLKKELNDARAAVVDIDKAYRDLSKAIETNLSIYQQVGKAAESHHRKLIQLAQESFEQEDRLRDENYKAELADFDRRLNAAVSARREMEAQQRAIMEFRAGMGERGAIPGVASPIRGGAAFPGSPDYFHPSSLAAYEKKLEDLRNKARLIAPDTAEWKQVNREILRTEKSVDRLQKMQTGGPSTRSRLGAAGGAFLYGGGLGGGVGSALGGVIGGLGGGVPGAFAGAALGQIADNLTAATAAMTEQAASVKRLQGGLASASNSFNDFAVSVQLVEELSNKLLLPLDQVYKKYIQLRTGTVELGYDAKTTAKIFEGTAAAVMRTGGSLDDVDGAMRAVVQVLSKGKLTAEELRGQLGERLAGAVIKYAKANNMSMQQVEEDFQNGQGSIDKFFVFLKKESSDAQGYFDDIAGSSEFAGARLSKAMERMRLNIGNALQPTGAAIQDFFTGVINATDAAIKKLIEFQLLQPGKSFYVAEALQRESTKEGSGIGELRKQYSEQLNLIQKLQSQFIRPDKSIFETVFGFESDEEKRLRIILEALKELEKYSKATQQRKKQQQDQFDKKKAESLLDAIEKRQQSIDNARKQREEEIARIRKEAIKEVEQIERSYKDKRLQVERELAKVRRDLASSGQEQSFLRRELEAPFSGEDKQLIEQERQAAEVLRKYTEEKIAIEENAQDEQIQKSRTLEDFKKKTADAINEANVRYAKAIGEAQRQYAKSAAEIIGKGTKDAAKRLESAGKLVALYQERASLNQQVAAVSGFPVPEATDGRYRFSSVSPIPFTEEEILASAQFRNVQLQTKNIFDIDKKIAAIRKNLEAPVSGGLGVSVEKISVNVGDLNERIERAALGLTSVSNQARNAKNALADEGVITGLLQSYVRQTDEIGNGISSLKGQEKLVKSQINLINSGVLPALAEEEAIRSRSFSNAIQQARVTAKSYIAGTKDEAIQKKINEEYNKQIDALLRLETVYASLQQSARDYAVALETAGVKRQAQLAGAGLRAGFVGEGRRVFESKIQAGASQSMAVEAAKAAEQLEIANLKANSFEDTIQGVSSLMGGIPLSITSIITGFDTLAERTALGDQIKNLEKLREGTDKNSESYKNYTQKLREAKLQMQDLSDTGKRVRAGLAEFFNGIANALAQAAQRMIATYIAIGIARMFAFGGGGGGNFSASPDFAGGMSNSFTGNFGSGPGGLGTLDTFGAAMPDFTGGITGGVMKFANGGMVTGPTLGLVGEGRYNEAIVPLPDGKSIPVELGGAAGSQIVSNITVNVSNGQAQSNATGANSSELGRKLEGAVKQVIIGELRPGGLLSR